MEGCLVVWQIGTDTFKEGNYISWCVSHEQNHDNTVNTRSIHKELVETQLLLIIELHTLDSCYLVYIKTVFINISY